MAAPVPQPTPRAQAAASEAASPRPSPLFLCRCSVPILSHLTPPPLSPPLHLLFPLTRRPQWPLQAALCYTDLDQRGAAHAAVQRVLPLRADSPQRHWRDPVRLWRRRPRLSQPSADLRHLRGPYRVASAQAVRHAPVPADCGRDPAGACGAPSLGHARARANGEPRLPGACAVLQRALSQRQLHLPGVRRRHVLPLGRGSFFALALLLFFLFEVPHRPAPLPRSTVSHAS